MQTEDCEQEAFEMVWEALKVPQNLVTHHKLTKDKFADYYGPKIKECINQKRTDIQANMKRSARGKL